MIKPTHVQTQASLNVCSHSRQFFMGSSLRHRRADPDTNETGISNGFDTHDILKLIITRVNRKKINHSIPPSNVKNLIEISYIYGIQIPLIDLSQSKYDIKKKKQNLLNV